MCLYPRIIENRKYKKTKKNGGIIPPCKDERCKYVSIGCQECIECRKQKQRAWQARLQEEIKHNTGEMRFITLTFSTESIKKLIQEDTPSNNKLKYKKDYTPLAELSGYALDNAICIRSVRLFLGRWRKKYGKSLKHWLITELGTKHSEHVHMHGIVWLEKWYNKKTKKYEHQFDELEKIWGYGYVWKGYSKNGKWENYVNAKTINYIVKYVSKIDAKHPNFKGKILTTPGIGEQYTKSYDSQNNKYVGLRTKEYYKTNSGHKIALPIYWRNKIYSEEERENLWIEKLDKGERWICGEKVMEKNIEHYYNLLNYHRERTAKLGYQNPEIIWEKKAYEEQRRQLQYHKRFYESEINYSAASPPYFPLGKH